MWHIYCIIFILLITAIIYKRYSYNKCKYNLECLKKKVISDLKKIDNTLKETYLNKTMDDKDPLNEYFGGLDSWFSNDASSNLRISSPDTNTTFKSNDYDDSFKDADNNMILNGGIDKPLSPPVEPSKKNPSNIKIVEEIPKPVEKPFLGSCQFFNDTCPDKYQSLGNFSINSFG